MGVPVILKYVPDPNYFLWFYNVCSHLHCIMTFGFKPFYCSLSGTAVALTPLILYVAIGKPQQEANLRGGQLALNEVVIKDHF